MYVVYTIHEGKRFLFFLTHLGFEEHLHYDDNQDIYTYIQYVYMCVLSIYMYTSHTHIYLLTPILIGLAAQGVRLLGGKQLETESAMLA